MTCTVVIPAWNNAASLSKVLRALRPQLLRRDNVLVVDDGSTDATAELVRREQAAFDGHLRLSLQAHRGAAAARNTGMHAANTDLLLFLGADVIPDQHCVARHRAVHQRYQEETIGCLGFVTWDPQLPPTPFMIWLEQGGPQNSFGEIAGHQWVDPTRYCYAANSSFKRSFVVSLGGFDDRQFRTYGWEDCDFGIRFATRGGRLYYEPSARAYHAHFHSIHSWARRQKFAGESFVTFCRVHPARASTPSSAVGWRYAFRRLLYRSPVGATLRALARRAERRWILPWVYAKVSGWVFTDSVHRRAVENSSQDVQEPNNEKRGLFSSV